MKKGRHKPGKLRSAFRKAIFGGLAAIFISAAVESTGYELLDLPGGYNVLCEIDPTCRSLTEGEKEMARSVFGDRIDYERVKVFNRPWFGVPFEFEWKLAKPAIASGEDGDRFKIWPGIVFREATLRRNGSGMAPNGSIYWDADTYTDDFSRHSSLERKVSFMHEMTHVYQTQRGENIVWRAAIDGLTNKYSDLYNYDLDQVADFRDLHFEAQGDFIEDYFRLVTGYEQDAKPSSYDRQKLARYMTILAPHFPAVREKQEALGIECVVLPAKKTENLPPGPAPGS